MILRRDRRRLAAHGMLHGMLIAARVCAADPRPAFNFVSRTIATMNASHGDRRRS
jgi:hypothetical protein